MEPLPAEQHRAKRGQVSRHRERAGEAVDGDGDRLLGLVGLPARIAGLAPVLHVQGHRADVPGPLDQGAEVHLGVAVQAQELVQAPSQPGHDVLEARPAQVLTSLAEMGQGDEAEREEVGRQGGGPPGDVVAVHQGGGELAGEPVPFEEHVFPLVEVESRHVQEADAAGALRPVRSQPAVFDQEGGLDEEGQVGHSPADERQVEDQLLARGVAEAVRLLQAQDEGAGHGAARLYRLEQVGVEVPVERVGGAAEGAPERGAGWLGEVHGGLCRQREADAGQKQRLRPSGGGEGSRRGAGGSEGRHGKAADGGGPVLCPVDIGEEPASARQAGRTGCRPAGSLQILPSSFPGERAGAPSQAKAASSQWYAERGENRKGHEHLCPDDPAIAIRSRFNPESALSAEEGKLLRETSPGSQLPLF